MRICVVGRERVCQPSGAEHGDELPGDDAHIGGDRGQNIVQDDKCVSCVQGILDEADVDGDGQINYTEFYDLMTNNN